MEETKRVKSIDLQNQLLLSYSNQLIPVLLENGYIRIRGEGLAIESQLWESQGDYLVCKKLLISGKSIQNENKRKLQNILHPLIVNSPISDMF